VWVVCVWYESAFVYVCGVCGCVCVGAFVCVCMRVCGGVCVVCVCGVCVVYE